MELVRLVEFGGSLMSTFLYQQMKDENSTE